MEKLIYMIDRPKPYDIESFRQKLLTATVETIRATGGHTISIHVADLDDEVNAVAPGRLMGPWTDFGAKVSFWLDSEHLRGAIESYLQQQFPGISGYLVTEAIWQQPTTKDWENGERRPGVSFIGCLGKSPAMTDEQFFKHWEQHSYDSAKLLPLRTSYTRHTVVRRLTEGAPAYRGLILEHIPSLEIFTDDALLWDLSVAKEINKHTMEMMDFNLFLSGVTSEYHFD